MNRLEHLLTILMEECAELSKETAKTLRFGPNDRKTVDPSTINTNPDEPTNADKMEMEFNDLIAVVGMIRDEEPQLFRMGECDSWQAEKRIKVENYLDYSRKVGTLED